MSKGKYILTLSGVLFMVMLLVSGGTFAYWTWDAATAQKTNVVSVVSDNIEMTITPTTASATGLRPTGDCDKTGQHIKGTATVKIDNNTGVLARPSFVLKGKVVKGGSGTLDDTDLSHINYAVFDGSVSTCTLANALHKGTFKGVSTSGTWTDLKYTAGIDSTANGAGDDLANSSTTTSTYLSNTTFDAPAYTDNTTHTYTVFVWIDPDYTHTNTGTAVSDPLQNATISLTWSDSSRVIQVLS